LKSADPRVVRRIKEMTPQETGLLIGNLALYAGRLIRLKTRWMARPGLPKGFDAESLAMEAVKRVLDGTRHWDPDRDRDLLAYLKSVVKSILWDIQKAAEKEDVQDLGSANGKASVEDLPSKEIGPDDEAALSELQDRMLAELDLDEDKLVLMSIFEGNVKPSDIAHALGLSVDNVYRIRKKLNRRLQGLKDGG